MPKSNILENRGLARIEVQIPQEEKKRLLKSCQDNQRSLNNMIGYLIRLAVTEPERVGLKSAG